MRLLNSEIETKIQHNIVANLLQKKYDLARYLPELVFGLVTELVENGDRDSYWIAYRACRNLVKKEPIRVMDLLRVSEYKYKQKVYKRSDYPRN